MFQSSDHGHNLIVCHGQPSIAFLSGKSCIIKQSDLHVCAKELAKPCASMFGAVFGATGAGHPQKLG